MEWNIDKNQCTGCGNCLSACPKQLLSLSAWGEVNARGVRYAQIRDTSACIKCGNCEMMCTAGAIQVSENSGHDLIDKANIPPHAGCYLGSLAKALADAIDQLGIRERVVIFKKVTVDANLSVETYDYTDDRFYDDALAYKKAHPERIVVLMCSSSKQPSTQRNEERYLALSDENITIINTLNWFETTPDFGEVTRGGSHILEKLGELKKASYLARGSVRTPAQVRSLSGYIRQALQNQMDGKSYAIVEMVFPCFYRLAGRPQTLMPYEALHPINDWFSQKVAPDYPVGVILQ